jgi:glycosyltransferase 2 family protein
MNFKRAIQLLVGSVVGVVCLYFAFRGVPWSDLRSRIGGVPWYAHGLYLFALYAQMVMRSERWAIQARGLGTRAPTFRESLAINAVGAAGVFLLPFRLGELVRPVIGKERGIMGIGAGLGVTALERILDGVITTGFFGVVMLLIGDRPVPDIVRVGGWTALGVFGGGLVALVLAFRWREPSVRFWSWAFGLVHAGLAAKMVHLLKSFLDGLACFKTPTSFLAYMGLSITYWMLNGASMWMLLTFMGVDVAPIAAYFCLCFLVIGVMIPAPPGNVGTFHAFAAKGLVIMGVSSSDAAAFAVLLHGWQVVGLVAWAGLFVALGDVKLGGMRLTGAADKPQ